MSRRITKLTPDNYLKGLILTAVKLECHTSAEIIGQVQSTPYYYQEEDNEVTENFYTGDSGTVRTAITRLKNAGYLSLYERDEDGTITSRIKQHRPLNYYLTAVGRAHELNPHIKRERREQRISDEAYRLMQELLHDEPLFQEAVREFVRTNQVPKLNVIQQKAPIVRNPRIKQGKTEKIIIENPDGTEQEITTKQLQTALLAVDGIRIKERQHSDNITGYQIQMQGYQQQIADLVYELEGKDIKLSDIKRRNTGAIRIAQRKDLIYAVSGINPDELGSEVPVEVPVGADFFNAWGNIWGRKVKGARLFNRSSFELMADTNPEVGRGHASHELSYAEMDSIGMFISKIRRTGITVDAVNERMLKPVALVW